MKIKLKPCPFCGSSQVHFTNAKVLEECANFEDCCAYEEDEECCYIAVVCDMQKGGCGTTSGYRMSEKKAAESWNNRS